MTTTATLPVSTTTRTVVELVPCTGCGAPTPEDETSRTACGLDADMCADCATEHERQCWTCAAEAAATAD